MLNFFQKNARNLTKNAGKIAEKSTQKVSVWESEMTKTMEKQVHFCSRHPGPCRINSPKTCGNSAKKTDGKPPKPHRKCSKTVRKFAENSAGNRAKSRQKSAQNSAEKATKPCRQFPIMVPDVHRQAAISQGGALIRVAPLPSPKISPIFLNYYFASIFRDVILKIPRSEQTSPRPLLTVF